MATTNTTDARTYTFACFLDTPPSIDTWNGRCDSISGGTLEEAEWSARNHRVHVYVLDDENGRVVAYFPRPKVFWPTAA